MYAEPTSTRPATAPAPAPAPRLSLLARIRRFLDFRDAFTPTAAW